MKGLIFFVCLIHICFCGDDYYYNDNNGNSGDENRNNTEVRQICPERHIDCIRQVLGEKLDCEPLHHRRKHDRYVYNNFVDDIPHINGSFVWRNAIISGFNNYTINDIFINKKTDTLVFEVTLGMISVNSPKSAIYFYKKGREPIVTEDYATGIFSDVSLTLTMYHASDHKKRSRHIFTYLNSPIAIANIGPNFTPSDPMAALSLADSFAELPLSLKEIFLTQGQAFFFYFVNTAICDLKIGDGAHVTQDKVLHWF